MLEAQLVCPCKVASLPFLLQPLLLPPLELWLRFLLGCVGVHRIWFDTPRTLNLCTQILSSVAVLSVSGAQLSAMQGAGALSNPMSKQP
jgi:hypothetical protein